MTKGAITSDIRLMSPAEARTMRDTKPFERQRNLSRSNVERLRREMQRGRFIPGLQIYICRLPSGQEMIVNGNHTLEAIAGLETGIFVTITIFDVPDLHTAAEIYAVFDSQRNRSWADGLRAVGVGGDIPNAARMLPGLGLIEAGFNMTRLGAVSKSKLDRFALIDPYRDAMIHYESIRSTVRNSETSGYLALQAVQGVALATLKYQPSAAHDFWQMLADDNGLTDGMPAKAILGFLRRQKDRYATTLWRKNQLAATAQAWNSHFNGTLRNVCRPGDWGGFFILGTPWANGIEDVTDMPPLHL